VIAYDAGHGRRVAFRRARLIYEYRRPNRYVGDRGVFGPYVTGVNYSTPVETGYIATGLKTVLPIAR